MSAIQVAVSFEPMKVLQAVEKAEASALRRAAFQVFTLARAKVSTPNPKGKRAKHGSTPPAPPYKRTGKLLRSIRYHVDEERREAKVGILHMAIGFYGNFLEFGYKHGKTMVPERPFVRPALAETPAANYFVNLL